MISLRLDSRKTVWLLLGLLFLVFLGLNHSYLWKWMYPIAYQEEIQVASNKYEVDPYLLLSVIRVESNFIPDRESSRGATGLMQIMPDTAKWIVERRGDPLDHINRLKEPSINIDMGAWFLNGLSREFQGNWVSVLAAYNAGPGNVNKWIENGWKPSQETISEIPFGETRHYVQRVLYYYKKYTWIYENEFER